MVGVRRGQVCTEQGEAGSEERGVRSPEQRVPERSKARPRTGTAETANSRGVTLLGSG